jgi:hypothetical protein
MAAEPLVHGIPTAIEIAPVIGIQEAHVVGHFCHLAAYARVFLALLSPR